ncbi:hypothetical protein BJV82DRAFT_598928 [Fennellomyces sp. T-0311]|nr:hypothetical protein BJV82DRAFT_598928 [Fennellomyces sp. T-0311]
MASHPHSAIHLYNYLCAVRSTFTCVDDYQQQFENLLKLPRYSPELFTSVVTQLESVMTATPERQALWPELQHILASARQDPQYDSLLVRVTESFFFIRHVESVLENDSQLEAFVRSLLLDSSDAQHGEVMRSIASFLKTLDHTTRVGVESVLQQQRQSTEQDSTDMLLLRIRRILDDEVLFAAFSEIVDTDMVAGIQWSDTLLKIYELIRARKPEVWDSISSVLDQAQSSHDTTQYRSYEEYVQRNFLDDGGQQYLDGEADRARVEHMMDNLSMHAS